VKEPQCNYCGRPLEYDPRTKQNECMTEHCLGAVGYERRCAQLRIEPLRKSGGLKAGEEQ
jgi:hypothetical protein